MVATTTVTSMKRLLATLLLVALAGCGSPELALTRTEPTPVPTSPTCPPVHPLGYSSSDDSGCPTGYVPVLPSTTPTTSPVTSTSAPITVTSSPDTSSPRDVPADVPVYRNCDEVRAAGAAPIYEGDPGFLAKFDRDEDGVGCEV